MNGEISAHQALRFWHDVTISVVRDADADLTARQLAVLLAVYLETPPHTVRGLAERLGVAKPVITRALNTLGTLGLVERRRDVNDKRNVLVQRTVAGAAYLDRLAMTLRNEARRLYR